MEIKGGFEMRSSVELSAEMFIWVVKNELEALPAA